MARGHKFAKLKSSNHQNLAIHLILVPPKFPTIQYIMVPPKFWPCGLDYIQTSVPQSNLEMKAKHLSLKQQESVPVV